MCLAVPGKVVSMIEEESTAVVDYDGLRQTVSFLLAPDVSIGDTVLVHAGFIIQILSESYGEELQKLSRDAELI